MDDFAAGFFIFPFLSLSFTSLCSKQSLDISLKIHCRQAYVPVLPFCLLFLFFKLHEPLLARET